MSPPGDGTLLPPAATPAEFEALRRDETKLAPGVAAICARHLPDAGAASFTRFADGSLPVYAVGDDLVLKLYPPCYAEERDREALVLEVLEDKLPVPTPCVDAVGERDGWRYLLIRRLRGETLALAWPRIGAADREALAADLGAALAVLHDVRDARLGPVGPDWDRFVEEQRSSAVERQRAHGLDERWLERIPDFLADVELGDVTASSTVLLHTEIMREHLLVAPGTSGGWRLSGLFDFEPAMIGAPEYEFASVGLFVSRGESRLLRRILIAYGYHEARLDAALSRRFLVWTLLHRYSNLPWFMKRLPPPEGTETLEQLAEFWWGMGQGRR
jgi:hygromycin-B 7''-O-kinase